MHAEVLAHKPDALIGILGLAYKENTHSIKNSPSLALIATLHPWRIKVFDPVVQASAAGHPRAEGAANALAVAEGVDVLVIMTPWPEFRTLKAADLARVMAGRTVLDPYRVLDPQAATAAGLDHITLGSPVRRGKVAAHA
jgi:UDPglucose 6-dehydrogenase